MRLEVIHTSAEASRHVIKFRARLVNPTKDVIQGPVLLRSLSSRSIYGPIRPANPTNGIKGPGAIWDVSNSLPQGRLAPGEQSKEFTLDFELPDAAWPLRRMDGDTSLAFGYQADPHILVKKSSQ